MSNLHHRPITPPEAAKEKDSAPLLKKQAPTAPPKPPLSWRFKLLYAVVALSTLAYLSPRDDSNFSRTYAVCAGKRKGIFTVDEQNTQVDCMLVEGPYVRDTGSLHDIRERWKKAGGKSFTVRHLAPGTIVVPGLSDSHCHILEYGASRQIPLSLGKNAKETASFVSDYIKAHPDLESDPTHIIEGWGWDHASWDVEKMPTWGDLDAFPLIKGRPIILQSRDGHAIWVSRATLDANAPFPESVEGGVIVRDESGEPTGVFMDNAQELIKHPILTDDDLYRRFKTTVDHSLQHGLTSLHDAGFKPDSLAFFRRQTALGPLPIRIYGMTYFDENGSYWGNQITPLVGTPDDRLTARSVKIFADGALRTGGAALYEPYADNPSTSGQMRLPDHVFHEVIPRFLKDGWQVNVHAIGDRANGVVLDAFEEALEGANVSALRPRLEHAQIMTKEDMARLGRLGVIASIQPTHVISDMWFAEARLGPERVKGLYAFRSLLNNGARITLGSDFPVEGVNPLAGFYAAITRVSFDGKSPHGKGGWFPEQRLTRLEALRGMTIDPAYASFTEDILGSLEVGKRADFVVLDRDIMEVSVEEIMETRVLATFLDGAAAFGSL